MAFSFCIDSRDTSGSKSLSSIIGKYNVYRNFTYDMYSQLYDACVIPTMMYGAEVFRYINKISVISNSINCMHVYRNKT